MIVGISDDLKVEEYKSCLNPFIHGGGEEGDGKSIKVETN